MFHVEHERKEGNKMNYYDELKREANMAVNACSRIYAYQANGAITFAHYAKLITDEQFYELQNIIVKAVQKGHLK